MENIRNKQIDGLRGIMALMIVLFHLFCRYQQLYCNSNIQFMENWGIYGVCTFFMISGYFLSNLKDENDFILVLFLKKKILRLYPTYIVSLTLTTIILIVLKLPGNNVSALNYILNVFWINGFIGTPYIEGAHWYITSYISIIFICGMLKKLNLSNNPIAYMVVIILNCLCQILHIQVLPKFLGDGYIGMVFCGIVIRHMEQKENPDKFMWVVLMLFSLLFTWKIRGVHSLVGLLIGIVLCCGTITGRFHFLEFKLFQCLGAISFELYLVHQNIAYAIMFRLQSINERFSYCYPILALIVVLSLSSLIYIAKKMIVKKQKGLNRI